MSRIMAEITPDYEFQKLNCDHVDITYDMYANNSGVLDEGIGRVILSAERDYSYEDFFGILQDEKVFGFVVNERIPFQEYHDEHYSEDIVYMPVIKGFLVYEINDSRYNILFMESESKNEIYYNKLLTHLKDKLKDSKKCKSIEIEIFDLNDKYYLMKLLRTNGFRQKSLVRATKGPDSYIFCYP